MANISLHALSFLKKHMTEFLGINFGRFCSIVVVTRHQIILFPTGGLCSGKWQAIKAVPCGRWASARVCFATYSFHCLHELDRQNAAKPMSEPQLEIANSVVCNSLMIWFCFLRQNLASRAQ